MNTATKQPTKRELTINFYKTQNATFEQYGELLFFQYISSKHGQPCAGYFTKRGNKPAELYRFNTEAQAAQMVSKWKETHDKEQTERAAHLAKYELERQKFVPGAVLVSTWGYEQTNVDFYLITERKGDFITLQKIGKQKHYTGDMNGNATPNPEVKGDTFRKKVSKWASVDLTSYSCAMLWNGRPVGFSEWA